MLLLGEAKYITSFDSIKSSELRQTSNGNVLQTKSIFFDKIHWFLRMETDYEYFIYYTELIIFISLIGILIQYLFYPYF